MKFVPTVAGGGDGGSESDYLKRLLGLASRCGVTRLADITRLDQVGMPVWQAVRPAGRSLSVHQGKGATPLHARIGALSEAIESDCAERTEADGPVAPFEQLAKSERAPRVCDYSRSRELPRPNGPIAWCAALDVVTGKAQYLPHALVSLDFTLPPEPYFERSSTGLGAGPDEAYALRTALAELVERDAVGEWERAGLIDRMAASVALDSVAFAWFEAYRGTLAELGASLRLFAPPAAIDLPVFVCWIEGPERYGTRWRRFGGSGAHGDPEQALFRAVSEALQSRLTFIAAVRDDMLPSAYDQDQGPSVALLPPTPPGFAQLEWDELPVHGASAADIVLSLTAAGYRQIAAKRIEGNLEGIAVVKAFVPGLGSPTRARRQ